MTRKDEIIKAAQKDNIVYDARDRAMFLEGAQWADRNPADETIQRIVTLYREWFTSDSPTGMVDYIKQHLKS